MSTIDEEMVLAHFIVSDDVERSRRFYTEVLGGKTVISGEPGDEVTYVALANSWIIINVGGGPTDDKPTVTLETPPDPDRVSSFLNIRVADIQAVYAEWSARGAQFLTPPKQHETEIRCYIRDPDGYLIEVGQTTLRQRLASTVLTTRVGAPSQARASRRRDRSDRSPIERWVHRSVVTQAARRAALGQSEPTRSMPRTASGVRPSKRADGARLRWSAPTPIAWPSCVLSCLPSSPPRSDAARRSG